MPADIVLTEDAVVLTSQPGKAKPADGTRLEMFGSKTTIEVTSGQGRVVITAGDVSVTNSVQARELDAHEVVLRPPALGEGHPGGTLELANKNGAVTIEVVADQGDIRLQSVGSLVAKIQSLEARIAALES